ncbi:MAG: FtsX-like permease family protein, partial [Gammaproteobacteria bacterium]|nr:FtsX-like permease family protein [Gammaproteobacteria bacterium]
TGTPVDRTLHISLEGIEAMHLGWRNGVQIPGANTSIKRARGDQLQPKSITAFLLGLDNKITAFKLQRYINQYKAEPLLAIFPGVALHELWGMMGIAEKILLAISSFVVVASLIGMLAVSLAGLNERRREIAILRSVGAGYRHIVGLLVVESTLLTITGIIAGLILLYSGLAIAQPLIESNYGLHIPITWPNVRESGILSILIAAGISVGLIPAYRAYRNSLLDGMSARI